MPLFTVVQNGIKHFPTQDYVCRRLFTLMKQIALPAEQYGTHSLRRGGATWMFLAGIPIEVIKQIGDWKSDCIYKYIKPNIKDTAKIVHDAINSIM